MMRFNLFVIFLLFLTACGTSSGARPTRTVRPPQPTATPAPTQTTDQRYLSIAQDGALPVVRSGAPKGEWKVDVLGPTVRIDYPMTIGMSNEQTVRQAKLQGAGIVKRLFDAEPALSRVNVVGTLPDGANGAELAAVSLVVERAAYAAWDGSADSLPWNVSPRLQ